MVAALKKSGARKYKAQAKARKTAVKTLITALLDSGMAQSEIGSYVGVSQPAISNNLSGRTTPPLARLSMLVDLARLRRVDLPEQFSWREL